MPASPPSWSSHIEDVDREDIPMRENPEPTGETFQPTSTGGESLSLLHPQTNTRQQINLAARVENVLRHYGLQFLYIFFANIVHVIKERRRIVFFQDRPSAALAALLHFPAIAATIVLAYFIYGEYYIGGELAGPSGYDKEKFLGLQFAAKLHELLMLASLSTVVFTMVRQELALGQGVPFGSLSAGLQISEISFFWSPEFTAICTGEFSAVWKKLFFIATIFLCTLLGVAVAPASATAMHPVYDFWPAGGTDIWLNSTADQLFPAILDDSHTLGSICATSGHDACPSAQWDTLTGEFLSQLPNDDQIVDNLERRTPGSLNVRGRNSMLTLSVDVRAPVYDSFTWNYSVACIPHVAVADSIVLNSEFWDLAARNSTAHGEYRFQYRAAEAFSLFAPAPTTHARCQSTIQEVGSLTPPVFPDFQDIEFPPITISDVNVQNWLSSTLPNITRPELFWFDLPTAFTKNASIGAVIAIPNDSATSSVEIWGCMIDARWVGMNVGADRTGRIANGQPQGFHIVGTTPAGTWLTLGGYGNRATIRPSFAQYLNPTIASSNVTVFQEMATASKLWGPGTFNGSRSTSRLEATLNLMVTNGMARTAPYVTQQGNILNYDNGTGPWWRGFMPIPPQVFGPGGNAYDVTPEQQKSFYCMHLHCLSQGYAYNRSSTAVLLSMVILLVYAGVATTFVTWSVVSGFCSSSWDSTSELIALAFRSPSPPVLENTAAGFSTIDSLRRRYCVVADGDQIQLRHVEGKVPAQNRVRPNCKYG